MRKLLIICLSLTLSCMALLGLISARAASLETSNRVLAVEAIAPPDSPQGQAAGEGLASQDPAQPVDAAPEENTPENSTTPNGLRPPRLALTFDDGPSSSTTPLLLDGLLERDVQVTFFMVGARAEKNPEIVLRAYEEGHVLGGHSYDHNERLTRLNNTDLAKQVQGTAEIIGRITESEPPQLLRPPYGAIDGPTALKTGKVIMMWNIDPRDWDVRDTQKVYQHILDNAVDGGVIILHDIVAPTIDGVLMAIDELHSRGWEFVTIPELFAAYDIPLVPGGIYHSPTYYKLP